MNETTYLNESADPPKIPDQPALDLARPSQGWRFPQTMRADVRYRWWRPIALTATVAALAALMVGAVVLVFVGIAAVAGGAGVEAAIDGEDLANPVFFVFAMATVIVLLPAALLGNRLVNGRRSARRSGSTLSSVQRRLRWNMLWRCVGWSLALVVPLYLIGALLQEGTDAVHLDSQALVMLGLVLLLVPFQAAAEEYVFRGVLMQAIGSWLRHPAFAIVLPIPVFVAGHAYGVYGLIDVAVFAVLAGWLTWRTGGLEAAIAMHVVNNVTLFGLAAVGLGDVNATDTTLAGVLVTTGIAAAYAWLVHSREAGRVQHNLVAVSAPAA